MTDYRTADTPPIPPSEDRCWHGSQELRRRVFSNGSTHFVMQCQTCGAQLRSVPKSDPLRANLTGVPPCFDEDLQGQYWDERFVKMRERTQQAQAERAKRQSEWWAGYHRYINSPEWRAKADRRLAMDKRQCQARLPHCTLSASQVHHLTYDHFGNEPLFELVSVCRSCHNQLTEMDRQKGIAA